MRIVSGKLKGRIIPNKKIEGTRPTMDRVKESLFAMIQDYIEESVFVDLFAGSGSIGIEAISNVAKTFVQDGLDAVLKLKRNINSNNARRKVDGRMEARIVEIACGPVPEGHARWTIRLLENQAKIEFDEPISREAIRRTLKKTGLDLTAANTGAYQTKQTQNS